MLDDKEFKQTMREFFSPLQRWRFHSMIDHLKAFFNSWRT